MNEQELRQLYLDLIKKSLIGLLDEDKPLHLHTISYQGRSAEPTRFVRKFREMGRDTPSRAFSAIGLRRMDNLQSCIESVLADRIAGDLMETGVWRGGACIFMRALLKAYGVNDRVVWAADSFEGFPVADVTQYPHDQSWVGTEGAFAVGLDTVQQNFSRYGLLDEQVHFLKGWFRDTLPAAPVSRLAVLRLDGDLYESTIDALQHLYPKLAAGGFLIVDDYHIPSARQAVSDYRAQNGIAEELQDIDGWAVYWRRQ